MVIAVVTTMMAGPLLDLLGARSRDKLLPVAAEPLAAVTWIA